MTRFVYVDNSNLWIEGRRLSAVRVGMCRTIGEAQSQGIFNPNWNYDFGELYRIACPPGETLGRISLFGSTPPPSDTIGQIARTIGFEVELFARNARNQDKRVDTAIATRILEDSYERMQPGDLVILVSGDGDFVPTVDSLKDRGMKVRNMFWSHGSHELRSLADEFYELDRYFEELSI